MTHAHRHTQERNEELMRRAAVHIRALVMGMAQNSMRDQMAAYNAILGLTMDLRDSYTLTADQIVDGILSKLEVSK